jgi:hypothetical protein
MQQAFAQTIIKVGSGNSGDYRTLTEALSSVPTTLDRSYEIQLLNNLNESVVIQHKGTGSRQLVIKPASGVTGISINGTVTFNGASFVTLSGNNGASARQLSVEQNSTSQPALVLTGDSRNVTVSDARLLGGNAASSGGVVEISAGTSSGNDDNTLSGNYIANESSNRVPANLVYVAPGTSSVANDRVSLISNDFANYASNGVTVGVFNGSGWRIQDNSFFYSLSQQPTTAQTAVNFLPGSGSNSNIISGNYIGGTVSQAASGTWTNAGSQDFRGIVVECGSGTGTEANVLQNNIVRNISLSLANNPQSFQALLMNAGRCELTNNSVASVFNNGRGGVNALVTQAQTVLQGYSLPSNQIMLIRSGQTLVNGDLTLRGTLNNNGGDIVINGAFTNTGFFAQTLGNLEVKGNMNNTGEFSCTTGGVLLTGTGPQSVSGGLYYNLEVRGSGVKTLLDDIRLANNLVMNGGILATGSAKVVLGNNALLTETETSYVQGQVQAVRYPFNGYTETFGNIGMNLTPAPNSVLPGRTTVSRYTGTPISANGNQGIKRYFDITAEVNSGLNAEMRIDYLTSELNGIAPADLLFFKSSDNGANWQPKGISSSGANFAVLSNVDGFSRWTLGSRSRPLPVGLTAFRAQRQQQTAVLTWTTATEVNNRGFGVEVSTDGRTYRQLAFVTAQEGSTTTARNYRFVDTEAGKQGLRYYRLRQDDTDGKVSYLGVRTVSFETNSALAAYPTAFEGGFEVELNSPVAGPATFTLVDALGRVVWTQQHEVTTGMSHLRVEPTCPAGTYLLTAVVGGQRYQQRVVRK